MTTTDPTPWCHHTHHGHHPAQYLVTARGPTHSYAATTCQRHLDHTLTKAAKHTGGIPDTQPLADTPTTPQEDHQTTLF